MRLIPPWDQAPGAIHEQNHVRIAADIPNPNQFLLITTQNEQTDGIRLRQFVSGDYRQPTVGLLCLGSLAPQDAVEDIDARS